MVINPYIFKRDDSTSFITTWETTAPDESITIPTNGGGYNYRVDWGDGTVTQGHTGDATHIYAVAGTYTVKISGDFPRIYFNNTGDRLKIKSIEQWGSIVWGSNLAAAFMGCENLQLNAIDAPYLSNTNILTSFFRGCTVLNVDLNHWDVGNVQQMNGMFLGAINFNGNISDWDVGNCFNFLQMFQNAQSFNQDISGWNAPFGNIGNMFYGATSFDQDLSNWNFENATNVNNFLNGATLSIANYDALLISMASQDLNPDLTFHGGNSKYSTAGQIAKQHIIDTYNWTFADGGLE